MGESEPERHPLLNRPRLSVFCCPIAVKTPKVMDTQSPGRRGILLYRFWLGLGRAWENDLAPVDFTAAFKAPEDWRSL